MKTANRYVTILHFRLFQIFYEVFSRIVIHQRFEFLYKHFISNKQPYKLIIIGAHDGISHDSIYKLLHADKFSGIFIEPNKLYFNKLKQNYPHSENIIFKNIAIHNSMKTMILNSVKDTSLDKYPDWADGLGSFNKEHLLKNKIQPEDIDSVTVDCETLMDVISNNPDFKNIRYLQIDTEGYDYEIIISLNMDIIRPKIIRFEYVNLSSVEIKESIAYLKKYNYYTFYDNIDLVAVNTCNFFRS